MRIWTYWLPWRSPIACTDALTFFSLSQEMKRNDVIAEVLGFVFGNLFLSSSSNDDLLDLSLWTLSRCFVSRIVEGDWLCVEIEIVTWSHTSRCSRVGSRWLTCPRWSLVVVVFIQRSFRTSLVWPCRSECRSFFQRNTTNRDDRECVVTEPPLDSWGTKTTCS